MGEGTPKGTLRCILLGIIVVGSGGAIWAASRYLTFDRLHDNYETLESWRDGHMALAIAGYMATYIAAVAFSVPGAVWLTLIGGFLFGVTAGSAIVVLSATAGATLIFLAAQTVLGDTLRDRAGGWIERLERGFRDGEVSFLLVMRLVPAVPFFVANLAPAFLGARLRHFVWTTLVGIIPGTVVFVSLGSGLGQQLDRGERPDLSVIFQPYILGPLLGLAALAGLPVVLKALGVVGPRGGPAE